ncbi:MAG: hypothetical protein HON90_11405, partial [Halobacteriovoraceae bacterium]|nr:hypothetical protein [Halobacteriovoraceae bacterium]
NINLHQKKWSVFENNNDSNIALAWTVFVRDREIFLEKYPLFEIESIKYNTCITYLLSGGFRLRPLLPTKVLRIINQFENWIIKRITNKIAVSMVVKVIKK